MFCNYHVINARCNSLARNVCNSSDTKWRKSLLFHKAQILIIIFTRQLKSFNSIGLWQRYVPHSYDLFLFGGRGGGFIHRLICLMKRDVSTIRSVSVFRQGKYLILWSLKESWTENRVLPVQFSRDLYQWRLHTKLDNHKVINLIDYSGFSFHTREWMPAESARGLHDKRTDIRDKRPRFRSNNTGYSSLC